MKEDNELWLKKLKDKLDDYAEPIPEGGWERLESQLNKPKRIALFPSKTWIAAAAAIAVLVITSVSVFFLHSPMAEDVQFISEQIETYPTNNSPIVPSVQVKDKQVARSYPVLTQPIHRLTKTELQHIVKEDSTADFLAEEDKQSIKVVASDSISSEKQFRNSRASSVVMSSTATSQPIHSKRRKKWSTSVHVANISGLIGNAQRSNMAIHMPVFVDNPRPLSMQGVTDKSLLLPKEQYVIFKNGIPYFQRREDVAHVKYHQPVSVGLSVRKGLKQRFSIETGLTYTLLSSDITYSSYEQVVHQKLHYLGIPLRINWDFLQSNRIIMYLSGGGQIEKCISAKVEHTNLDSKPWQFSVLGAVGVQVNLMKHWGIYAEPGIAYFFDNHSSIPTIRQHSPVNFNLQAGLRFSY